MHFAKNQQHGFSLIEMMFVIVLIGIITAITITALKGKVTDDTINKAASDMELILQADQSYYTDNQKPPTSMEQLATYLTLPITNGNIYNPWGYSYNLVNNQNQPGKLQIATTTPDTKTATQLASLVPGGVCTSANCSNREVLASVPVNIGKHMEVNKYKLYWPKIGGQSDVEVKKLSCPTGYTANVMTDLPHWEGSYNTYFVAPAGYGDKSMGSTAYPVTNFFVTNRSYTANDGSDWWLVNVWYELSWNPQYGPDSGAKPLDPSASAGDSGDDPISSSNTLFTSDRFQVNNYQDKVMVGLNRPDKNEDPTNSWYPALTGNCDNVLCSNSPRVGNQDSSMNYGYIGTLKVMQWCEKDS